MSGSRGNLRDPSETQVLSLGEPGRLQTASRSARLPLYAAGVLFCLYVFRVSIIASQGESGIIGSIPDDSFYYLFPAWQFSDSSAWTFDLETPTSGFHPLFAAQQLLLATLGVPFELPWIFLSNSILASANLALAAGVTLKAMQQCWPTWHSIALGSLAFLLPMTFVESTLVMESSLVVLACALAFWAMMKDPAPARSMVIAIGVLGGLSRTDWPVFALVLVLSATVSTFLSRSPNFLRRSLWLLIGALAGIGFGRLFTYAVVGSAGQGSIQIKMHWFSLGGISPTDSLRQVLQGIAGSFDGSWPVALGLALLACLLSAYALFTAPRFNLPDAQFSVLTALLATLVFFMYFAVVSMGLNLWYLAYLVIPFSYILASVGFVIGSSTALTRRQQLGVTGLVAAPFLAYSLGNLTWVPWPSQQSQFHELRALEVPASSGKIGSWSSGMVRFVVGSQVQNLDGLANDAIIPFITSGSTQQYLEDRDIEVLVNLPGPWTSAQIAHKHGLDHDWLLNCYRALNRDGTLSEAGVVHGSVGVYRRHPQCTSVSAASIRVDPEFPDEQ